MNAPTYSFDTEHSEDGVQVLPQASDNGRLRSGRSDDSEGDLRAFLDAPERPAANCCTRPVAAAFLLFVAVALVVTWQVLPLEDLVASYLPQFDEPTVPYTGKEAGTLDAPLSGGAADDGGAGEDDGGDEGDGDEVVVELPPDNAERPGTSVPEFMACPTGGGRRCCNGAVDNCGLRVDQMLFGMVHNAMSSEEGGFFFGYNHKLPLERALVAGYRALNLDVCVCEGALQFCHNICNYGERYPRDVFGNVAQFLDDDPSEVVVLLFQASSGRESLVWNELHREMAAAAGLADRIYAHQRGTRWPTMGELVDSDRRVIVFYFNGGTCDDGGCPPGFHPFYNYAAETQYQSSSLDDLRDYEYSCEITRGPKEDAAFGPDFLVVNNFVTPPDFDAAAITNSRAFLAERLTNCANRAQMRPNFVYLDFWSQGVTAQLVQYTNKQTAARLGQ